MIVPIPVTTDRSDSVVESTFLFVISQTTVCMFTCTKTDWTHTHTVTHTISCCVWWLWQDMCIVWWRQLHPVTTGWCTTPVLSPVQQMWVISRASVGYSLTTITTVTTVIDQVNCVLSDYPTGFDCTGHLLFGRNSLCYCTCICNSQPE